MSESSSIFSPEDLQLLATRLNAGKVRSALIQCVESAAVKQIMEINSQIAQKRSIIETIESQILELQQKKEALLDAVPEAESEE